jgi:hypothetical protein
MCDVSVCICAAALPFGALGRFTVSVHADKRNSWGMQLSPNNAQFAIPLPFTPPSLPAPAPASKPAAAASTAAAAPAPAPAPAPAAALSTRAAALATAAKNVSPLALLPQFPLAVVWTCAHLPPSPGGMACIPHSFGNSLIRLLVVRCIATQCKRRLCVVW